MKLTENLKDRRKNFRDFEKFEKFIELSVRVCDGCVEDVGQDGGFAFGSDFAVD
jgi:hypothetical protein